MAPSPRPPGDRPVMASKGCIASEAIVCLEKKGFSPYGFWFGENKILTSTIKICSTKEKFPTTS